MDIEAAYHLTDAPRRRQLLEDGFVHVTEPHSYEDFEKFAQALGALGEREDIAVNRAMTTLAQGERAIPFHNDGREAKYIGLYCVDPGEGEVIPTVLISVNNLLDELSSDCLQWLEHFTFVRAKNRAGLEKSFSVLERSNDSFSLYYVPWLMGGPHSAADQQHAREFFSYISRQATRQAYSVGLEQGQSLFFDNHRMLHGRGALPAGSSRCLKRIWINAI